MKLSVSFERLIQNVYKMGIEEIIPIDLKSVSGKVKPIKIPIINEPYPSDGGGVTRLQNGLLSYKDRHVFLLIPDHSYIGVDAVIQNPNNGNRFHIADCETLIDMLGKQRFTRYHITNNKTGIFRISDSTKEVETKLNVCRNCLSKINYKGYNDNYSNKNIIFNEFDLNEFFTLYESYFSQKPKYVGQDKQGYPKNWAEISKRYRESQNYCCESCGVNLSQYPYLLHTHHIDGVKHHIDFSNFRAVCVECHSKEDMHEHMQINLGDLGLLARLRKEQHIAWW